MKIRVLIMCLLVAGLAACNRGNVSDVQRDANGGLDATVSLRYDYWTNTDGVARMTNDAVDIRPQRARRALVEPRKLDLGQRST